MKKIQSQLIKPFVEKMEMEWQSFYDKLQNSKDPEAVELRPLAQSQLEKLRLLVAQAEQGKMAVSDSTESVHDFIRQSKMDFRSAERRWVRHLVSTERVKTRIANHSAKFSPSSPKKP